MKTIYTIPVLALLLASGSCSLFGPKIRPYPVGIMFPVMEESRLTVAGRINGLISRVGGYLCFSTEKGNIICLDADKRRILWTFAAENPLAEPPLPGGERIYVFDTAGMVYALDLEGNLLWKKKFAENLSTHLAERNGRIYFGLENGEIICLKGREGELDWSFKAGAEARAGAVFWGDSAVFGCEDGRFYILDSRGKLTAGIKTQLKIREYLGVDGDRLYFGTDRNDICCLNLAGKKISWKIVTGGRILAPPLTDDKRMYILGTNNVLTCLDKKAGDIRWWKIIPARTPFRLERSGDLILVSSLSSLVLCFDALTGRALGSYAVAEDPASGQMVASSNPVWLDPNLLVGFYDEQSDTGTLLFLSKEVKVLITPSSASPLKPGDEITFTAEATGFYQPRYEFFLRSGTRRDTVQKESEKFLWKWYPDKEGVYGIGVRVRDARQMIEAEIPFEIQKEN